MNIDATTGAVTFPMGTISQRLDRAAFLAMPFGKSAEPIPGGPGWINFMFDPEPGVFATIYFHEDRLKKFSFALELPNETRTPWGSNLESHRRAHHNAWLREQLGRPPYIYGWGEVFATSLLWTDDQVIDVDYAGPLGFGDRLKRRLRHWMRRLQEID